MSSRPVLTALFCLAFYSSTHSQKLIDGFTRELVMRPLPTSFAMKSFDATGDKVPELFVTTATRLLVYDGKTFNLIFQDSAAAGTANLSPADVNGDGQTDLVSTAGDSGVVVWYGPDFQSKSFFLVQRGFISLAVRNPSNGQIEFVFGFAHVHRTWCPIGLDSTKEVDGHMLRYIDTTFVLPDSIHLAGSPIFWEIKSVSAPASKDIAFIAMDDYYRPCMPSGLWRHIVLGYYDTALTNVGSFDFSKSPDAPCPRPLVLATQAIGNLDSDSGAEFAALATQPNSICGIPSSWDFRVYDMLTGTFQWSRTDSLGIISLFTLDLNDDSTDELLSYEIQNSKPGLVEYSTLDGATLGFTELPFTPTNLFVGKFGTSIEPKLLLADGDSLVVYSFGTATDVEEGPAKTNLPRQPELFPPIPNPFNSKTTIRYVLPLSGEMTLQIFDILGREVQTLFSGFQKAGQYQINWNASDLRGTPLASGIYFAVLKTKDTKVSQKLVLVK